jgi:ankyrin repeat protein
MLTQSPLSKEEILKIIEDDDYVRIEKSIKEKRLEYSSQTMTLKYKRSDGKEILVGNLLYYAIQGKHIAIIKYLLSCPEAKQLVADKFVYWDFKWRYSTFLHLAIETGDIEIVRLVCRPDLDVDVNFYSTGRLYNYEPYLGSPLATAIRLGYIDIFNFLCKKVDGINFDVNNEQIEHKGSCDHTLLHVVMLNCDLNQDSVEIIAKKLLHKMSLPLIMEYQNEKGQTACQLCIEKPLKLITKTIEDLKGACEEDDPTRLKEMCQNPIVVKCLQEMSLDYNRLDKVTFHNIKGSLLFYAIQGKHIAAIKYLLSRPEAKQLVTDKFTYVDYDYRTSTLLHLAIETGDIEIVRLVCRPDLDVDVNFYSDGRFSTCYNEPRQGTPLATAIRLGHIDILNFLCTVNGTDLAVQNKSSELLHLAIKTGKLEVVKLICRPDLGVDVNFDSGEGTPLATILRLGHIDIFNFLCEEVDGINFDVNNEQLDGDGHDNTLLHVALCYIRKNDVVDVVKTLLNKNPALLDKKPDAVFRLAIYNIKDVLDVLCSYKIPTWEIIEKVLGKVKEKKGKVSKDARGNIINLLSRFEFDFLSVKELFKLLNDLSSLTKGGENGLQSLYSKIVDVILKSHNEDDALRLIYEFYYLRFDKQTQEKINKVISTFIDKTKLTTVCGDENIKVDGMVIQYSSNKHGKISIKDDDIQQQLLTVYKTIEADRIGNHVILAALTFIYSLQKGTFSQKTIIINANEYVYFPFFCVDGGAFYASAVYHDDSKVKEYIENLSKYANKPWFEDESGKKVDLISLKYAHSELALISYLSLDSTIAQIVERLGELLKTTGDYRKIYGLVMDLVSEKTPCCDNLCFASLMGFQNSFKDKDHGFLAKLKEELSAKLHFKFPIREQFQMVTRIRAATEHPSARAVSKVNDSTIPYELNAKFAKRDSNNVMLYSIGDHVTIFSKSLSFSEEKLYPNSQHTLFISGSIVRREIKTGDKRIRFFITEKRVHKEEAESISENSSIAPKEGAEEPPTKKRRQEEVSL